MTHILFQSVTFRSLRISTNVGNVVRWQKELVRNSDTHVSFAGKKYRYEDVRDIWEKYASHHDEQGNLSLPFAFHLHDPTFVEE